MKTTARVLTPTERQYRNALQDVQEAHLEHGNTSSRDYHVAVQYANEIQAKLRAERGEST